MDTQPNLGEWCYRYRTMYDFVTVADNNILSIILDEKFGRYYSHILHF
jgi:hypothetical protein